MNMREYRSFGSYLKQKFGCKVYKISLSCSDSCPNRDGTRGVGGCIFCSNGSSDFSQKCDIPVSEQIENAKKLVEKKIKNGKYIAYFGSFTSTHGNLDKIKNALIGAANDESVVAVSVATRPDCLGAEIMEVLREVKKIKPLMVELGLQTVNPKTSELINRCSELAEFDNAIEILKKEGIEIVLHIILGLPFESKDDMLKTIRYAVQKGADGIKLQLLHVLEGTRLAEMYKKGDFEVLTMEEYLDILDSALALIPKTTVIHRLTGDGAKKNLIAPLWSANKKKVLSEINRRFKAI